MRLSKIYTKKGDAGSTQLATGVPAPKHGLRIQAYGDVDELNCVMGELIATLQQHEYEPVHLAGLLRIQQELFDLGGELAFPVDDPIIKYSKSYIRRDSIEQLEQEMDAWLQQLPPLADFVLPGGHIVNAKAHMCRSICRRAERAIVALHEHEPVREEVLAYVNRLSDWLFVFSREACRFYGVAEVLWDQTRYTPASSLSSS